MNLIQRQRQTLAIPLLLVSGLFAHCGHCGDRAQHDPSTGVSSFPRPDRQAFSKTLAFKDADQALEFQAGKSLFERLWVAAPSSTQAADGLGPLYNARACSACHPRNGRGKPPEDAQQQPIGLVMHLSVPDQEKATATLEPTYGRQLQTAAIAGHIAEGQLQIRYEDIPLTLHDNEIVTLRKPRYRIEQPAYGAFHADTRYSPRVAPALIGLGLLEAIDANDILKLADPDDRDGDGISGRAHAVHEGDRHEIGRFGWKANSARLDSQIQTAFAQDIGLSVTRFPDGAGDCTEKQTACKQAPNGNTPQFDNLEAGKIVTGLVDLYLRHIAVPEQRNAQAPNLKSGEQLFYQSGCHACHTPSHVTSATHENPAFAGQTIHPYTDLLLHDMGDGLADTGRNGRAGDREWRTAPLWGIGLIPDVNGHSFYLHDGRARSLLEAILWHGGEAEKSREAVVQMTVEQRQSLLQFIRSL